MDERTAEQGGKTIAAVERAADVLSLFAQSERATLGVTEIAQELHLPKAVVHRILTSLRGREFVELDADSRRYRLGPTALALGTRYLDRIDIRELARDAMRRLSDRTGETATFSIRHDSSRVYIDQVTPNREVKMTVLLGQPFPLHAGGSSKAFLAFLEAEAQEDYLRNHELTSMTPRTVTDPEKLRRELATIRRQGYATSLGERQAGAGSVAAPILDRSGHPVAVMSVCGPVERFSGEVKTVAPLLLAETQALSAKLGYAQRASA